MNNKQELWVGLFVSLALLIFILGISWGRGFSFGANHHMLTVRFQSVDGLEKGSPVVVRGIQRGRVQAISLHPQFAEVILRIDKGTVLYSDCRISIGIQELMGSKLVFINPGTSGRPIDWNQLQQGVVSDDMFAMFSTVNNLIVRIDTLVSSLSAVLNPNEIQNIQKNLSASTREMQEMIQSNRAYLTNISKRLDETTHMMVRDSLVSRAGVTISRMDSTFERLNSILVRVESDSGTMGKLIRDPELYDQLLATTKTADSLFKDIQANPKRYINISVF